MLVRCLRVLLLSLAACGIVGYIVVAAGTLSRTDALDPVEVTTLERAARFAGGGPLYAEPAHRDEPALMPGFPLAVAGLVQAFGPDLRQPRILTVFATLLLALVVLLAVRIETDGWTLAVSSAGLLLLGAMLLAEPPGVGRPETLVMTLALLGFLALRLSTGAWGAVLGALLLAAAVFAGPHGAWFAAAALCAMAIERGRRAVAYTLAVGVLVGAGHVLLSESLGPWFNFDAWDAPLRAARPNALAPLHYVGDQLLGRFGVLTLAVVLSFAMPTPPWRGKGGLWAWFGFAAVAAGLASTQSVIHGPGALIPTIVALALLGPVSIQRVTSHLSAWPGSTRLAGQGVVLTALVLQYVVFFSSVASSRWLTGAPAERPVPAIPAGQEFVREERPGPPAADPRSRSLAYASPRPVSR